jgi:hypothetical protein
MRRQGQRGAGLNAVQRGGMNSLAPLQRFAAYGLTAVWYTRRADSITLNGADVSALASLSVGGRDLSQLTPANQPLGTGAPIYGGAWCPWPSIQFTLANNDNLSRANTNLFGAGAWTVVSVQRMRNTAAGQQAIWESRNAAFTGGSLAIINATPNYVIQDETPGTVNHIGGVPRTTAPDVTIFAQGAGAVPTLRLNGVLTTLSAGAGGQADPGGAAFYAIGSMLAGLSADQDFLFQATFTMGIPDGVALCVSRACAALAGIAHAN